MSALDASEAPPKSSYPILNFLNITGPTDAKSLTRRKEVRSHVAFFQHRTARTKDGNPASRKGKQQSKRHITTAIIPFESDESGAIPKEDYLPNEVPISQRYDLLPMDSSFSGTGDLFRTYPILRDRTCSYIFSNCELPSYKSTDMALPNFQV